MTSDGELVQILIPCFNGQEYLEETLISIQNQTHTNFDCLMVDDGSSDNSPSIFNRFAQDDLRFRLLKNEKNQGESYTVNRAWNNKKANLICVLSFDDPQPHDWLKNMIEFRSENPGFIVYYPNRTTIDNDGTVLTREYLLDWDDELISMDFICIPSVGALIDSQRLPRDFSPRIDFIDYPSDLIQYLQLLNFGKGLRHPDFFCNWRRHSQNKSSLDREMLAEKLENGIKTYFSYIERPMHLYQIISLSSQCQRLKSLGSGKPLYSWTEWYKSLISKNVASYIQVNSTLIRVLIRYFFRRAKRLLKTFLHSAAIDPKCSVA